MIQITDKSVALWMVRLDSSQDFLMHLEDKGDGNFEIQSRLRTYNPKRPSPWADKDKKQWKVGAMKGDRDFVLAKCRDVIRDLTEASGGQSDEIMAGSVDEFLDALSQRPWAHLRKITKGEG